MERIVRQKLIEWSKLSKPKPLILRGARQVGKSYLARSLKSEFEQFIELNLEKPSDIQHFQNTSYSAKQTLESILLAKGMDFKPESTLLFVDEIQEEARAIEMLRYFYEDIPGLHVIAAGSLLEFAYKEIDSFPVGRVEQIAIRPMNFKEFLMAVDAKALDYYRMIPSPEIAEKKLFELFNTYLAIGGMPEAVKHYIDSGKTIIGLEDIYSSIWDSYQNDIEKYARSDSERKVIRYISSNLAMVGDRISFAGYGNSEYGSRKVSEAFSDLEKAGIFRLIYPTTDTVPPISENRKRKPRLQFLDTGLLAYSYDLTSSIYLKKDRNPKSRGKLIEHIMHQELLALSPRLSWKPKFWVREKSNSSAEVDAVIQHEGRVYPIEAKSGRSGSLRSLSEFMDRCDHDIAFRILDNSFNMEKITTRKGKEFRLFNIPFYSIGMIESWIEYAESL